MRNVRLVRLVLVRAKFEYESRFMVSIVEKNLADIPQRYNNNENLTWISRLFWLRVDLFAQHKPDEGRRARRQLSRQRLSDSAGYWSFLRSAVLAVLSRYVLEEVHEAYWRFSPWLQPFYRLWLLYQPTHQSVEELTALTQFMRNGPL